MQDGDYISAITSIDTNDWARESDRRSVGGLATRLNKQALTHWRVSKQIVIAKSTAEAELMALADHTDVVMCMRILLAELGLLQGATTVHEDNTAAISILNDTKYDQNADENPILTYENRHNIFVPANSSELMKMKPGPLKSLFLEGRQN
ncbi:integrase catalytic domain-containing protein [Pseudoscourfieldia marina]